MSTNQKFNNTKSSNQNVNRTKMFHVELTQSKKYQIISLAFIQIKIYFLSEI